MKVRHALRFIVPLFVCFSIFLAAALPKVTAQGGQVAAPVPYPDPPKLEVGGAAAVQLPLDQIVTYKALPKYHQAPWLDKLVAAGQLPPVEQRLPKEPQVYLKTGMKDGIGQYGDVWRAFSACPTAGYNEMAGVTMGWFGIESYTDRYNALVKTGPLFRATQDIQPMPEIGKSWEWSADGKQLTMHLIEGAKWSDGVAFNADDVMFTWEGYILDDNVATNKHQDSWTWDGKPATLEKVDDYTIKFTFPVSKPYDAFYLMNESNFDVMPAHQLKPLHPKWSTANPKPSYKDFANALAPDHLPLVTMGPWAITEYKTDELMILRRNPYYWKVDEEGNQLPYIDEITFRKGPTGIGRDLCTIAGDCDHMNLENPSGFVDAMTKAADPSAKFAVNWGPEVLGFGVEFNYSLGVGIQDKKRDTAVRTLLRDVRFRQALAYATDREGIAQSIMKGPFLRGWAGGMLPGAPGFDKTSVVYYPYDVASAKTLLAQIGLKAGSDGVLQWTDGPMSGQSVVLQLQAPQDQKESGSIAEALVNQWAAVGIKINMKIVDSQTNTDNRNNGTWDMSVQRTDAAFALPFTNPSRLGPITKTFNWNLEGSTPRKALDFEPQLVDIINKYRSTFDSTARATLIAQYNKLVTQNVYDLGIFVGRYGFGSAKRVKNIPAGTPVLLYQYVEDAVLLDQAWTPVDQQVAQVRPETIPVYAK